MNNRGFFNRMYTCGILIGAVWLSVSVGYLHSWSIRTRINLTIDGHPFAELRKAAADSPSPQRASGLHVKMHAFQNGKYIGFIDGAGSFVVASEGDLGLPSDVRATALFVWSEALSGVSTAGLLLAWVIRRMRNRVEPLALV